MTDFGATLKRHRLAANLSQPALAARAKLHHSYISRLEAGVRQPTREAVVRLAEALGVTKGSTRELLHAAGFVAGDEAIGPLSRNRLLLYFMKLREDAERMIELLKGATT